MEITAIIYLVIGAIAATAYVVYDAGLDVDGFQLVHIVKWLAITVFWLPVLVYYILKVAILLLLPVPVAHRIYDFLP